MGLMRPSGAKAVLAVLLILLAAYIAPVKSVEADLPDNAMAPALNPLQLELDGALPAPSAPTSWPSAGGDELAEAVPAELEASLSPGYKLVVRETGMYQLTYSYLLAAELPVDTLDPDTFQIFYHDQEIAIHVAGGGDGSFDAGDAILFYGEAISGKYVKYTKDNVYWLTYGLEAGRRMPTANFELSEDTGPATFEDTARFEQDKTYWSEMPGDGDDFPRWYWAGSYAPGNISQTVALSDVAPSTATEPLTATIRVAMVGRFDSSAPLDQHIVVYVNENWVGAFQWDGLTGYQAEFEFDQVYLNQGTGDNAFRFQVIQNPGVGYRDSASALDWFEVDYQRYYKAEGDALAHGGDVTGNIEIDGFTALPPEGTDDLTVFDVTQPLTVTRVLNTVWDESPPDSGNYRVRFADTASGPQSYWTGLPVARLSPVSISLDSPSDLRLTVNSADYIMITHRDFYTEILTLTNYYNGTGVDTVLVDVQDVYDEFSGGVFYPGAIHDFLSYAYTESGGVRPSYVLLVGDGHYDYTYNKTSTDMGQFIPPYMAYVDPEIGETAADNRYVCVAGDDNLPDIALGRFPVNTAAQAKAMVEKSINYQTNPPDDPDWNANMLFVADDYDITAGDFAGLSDEMIELIELLVPDTYTTTSIYYGTAGYTDVETTTSAIIDAISAGQLFVSYIGHAAYSWWADEKLFHVQDLTALANGEMLPIMLPMTCQEGFFAYPWSGTPSLSEVLVRAASGGALASFAPTGWGVASGHDYLQRGFFDAVYNQDIVRLGDATDAAKQYLWDNAPSGAYRDLIDTYVLLGDPALTINLPTENPTGVSMDSFTAEADPAGMVVLRWETITEFETLGFNLYRAQAGDGERLQLNPSLIRSDTPPGSPEGTDYEFLDYTAQPGLTYDYWLEEVDIRGEGKLYGPVRISVPAIPRLEYRLFLPVIQQRHG